LVTVLTMVMVFGAAVVSGGGSIEGPGRALFDRLLVLLQVITGAVVSATVTFWLHWAKLPQASVACQVRVHRNVVPQWPAMLVTVLTMVIVLVPLLSVAVGASKSRPRLARRSCWCCCR